MILPRSVTSRSLLISATLLSLALCGCQDGPLYALKAVNPYYALHEWKSDEVLGVSDHVRREQLVDLANTIHKLPAERQQFWAEKLSTMVENDVSPEMRRLAVHAVRRLDANLATPIIEKGLDDDSMKVRMEACRSLGLQSGDQAARLLAATVGTETNNDVKHAAVTALGKHQSQIAIDSLQLALSDRNPATRSLAVESLRGSTGKNYGDDPQVWIAALEGKPTEEAPTRFADRVRNLF